MKTKKKPEVPNPNPQEWMDVLACVRAGSPIHMAYLGRVDLSVLIEMDERVVFRVFPHASNRQRFEPFWLNYSPANLNRLSF